MQPEQAHTPVLIDAVVEQLDPCRGGVFVDATFGLGGHTTAMQQHCANSCPTVAVRYIGIDRDQAAIIRAQSQFPDVKLVQGNFAELGALLVQAGVQKFDGLIADLGFSSPQMADASRGFSFQRTGPLDMRYDTGQSLTAAEIVNHWNEVDVVRIIKDYSGERFAGRIARAIVRHRPIQSTTALAELVERAIPPQAGRRGATRTFQALRIAVNQELESLETMLNKIPQLVNPGARVALIAFHSLEDIKIRVALRSWKKLGLGEPVTKKPIVPSSQEIHANPRSRSAHLWIFQCN